MGSDRGAGDGLVGDTLEYVGPFDVTEVVIDGWKVPYLTAHKDAEGVVRSLSLDHRYAFDLPPADPDRPYEADVIVTFIAECIAVAAGYTCHPTADMTEPNRRTPYVRMNRIDFVESE